MDWFVISTKTNKEKIAEKNLILQGFEVFLPLIQKTRRHARRVDKVLRPIFPGYLFVRFDAAMARWRSINGTIGVRHILTNNGHPQTVAKNFVELLLGNLNEYGAVEDPKKTFAVGSKIEVVSGAMQGRLATILSADEQGRVQILLAMMGRKIVATISSEDLE